MTIETTLHRVRKQASTRNRPATIAAFRLPTYGFGQNQEQEPLQPQAELFYLQKQIQTQTPMVLVLEGGEEIEGCIEWYDKNVLKLRGRQKILVYKSAIKYMFKAGDQGQ
jgi:sRNA-binding regulator protein Hfq